jgi:AAHS family 3-hydroxyphenylpropionic acid transporter
MEEQKVVGYSWVVFGVVLFTHSIALGFGMNCIPPFLTTIAEELNLNFTQVGLAWGMIGLGALIFSVIGGLISDRIGIRWTGFLGLLLLALGGAMRGIADAYLTLLVAMFLFGVAMGLARPNLPRALSQWFPPNRRGMVNGIAVAGGAFGSALAMAISASVLGPWLGGWRNIVLILGAVTSLLAILWLLLVRERIFGEPSAPDFSSVMKGFGIVLRSKSVWVMSIISLLLFGHSRAWSSHMPGFFEHKYGMTNAAGANFVSITLFAAIFAAIIGPTISDRIGLRKPALLIACIVGGSANLIQGSFLGWILFAILIIMPFGQGTISPLMYTIPFELKQLHHTMAGTAIGMIFTFQNIGAFIYPILSGKLIDLFAPNYYPFFTAQMLAFAVSFLLIWWMLPETGPKASKPANSEEGVAG